MHPEEAYVLVSVPDKLLRGASCGSQVAEKDEKMNPRVLPVLCKVCELVTGGLAQPSSSSQPDTTDQATMGWDHSSPTAVRL